MTTTTKQITETAARNILGERNYNIMLNHYSIGRLALAMTRADEDGNTRRGDAIYSIIRRRQMEGVRV